MTLRHRLLALTIAATVPAAAMAHPRLVSATPAADATVAAAPTITLRFSERLLPKLSAATLTMTGMPGMASHPAMEMKGIASAVTADGTGLTLKSAKPLPAATYRVDWHVVSADTHRIAGAYSFKVR